MIVGPTAFGLAYAAGMVFKKVAYDPNIMYVISHHDFTIKLVILARHPIYGLYRFKVFKTIFFNT